MTLIKWHLRKETEFLCRFKSATDKQKNTRLLFSEFVSLSFCWVIFATNSSQGHLNECIKFSSVHIMCPRVSTGVLHHSGHDALMFNNHKISRYLFIFKTNTMKFNCGQTQMCPNTFWSRCIWLLVWLNAYWFLPERHRCSSEETPTQSSCWYSSQHWSGTWYSASLCWSSATAAERQNNRQHFTIKLIHNEKTNILKWNSLF